MLLSIAGLLGWSMSRPLARGGGWRRLPSGAQTQPQRRGGTGTSILLLGFPWKFGMRQNGTGASDPGLAQSA